MDKRFTHSEQIHAFLLGLVAFTLPFSIRLNTWMIIAAGIFWLFSGNLTRKVKEAASSWYVVFLWLFFLAYVISSLVSTNKVEAYSIIERRASLLFIPLLLTGISSVDILLKRITLFFVTGIVCAFIICFAYTAYISMPDTQADVFFYHSLTSVLDFNAVYMSALCVIAVCLLLFYRKELPKFFVITSLLILLVFLVLLSSKMMLFVLLITFVVFVFYKLNKRWAVILSVATIVVMLVVIMFVPQVKKRVQLELDTKMDVVQLDTFRYDTPLSGTSLRLVLLKLSKEILNEKQAWLTGINAGDFQDVLNNKYREKGLYTGNPQLGDSGYLGYGPHNMYVEILLSMGVFVFIFFTGGWFIYGLSAIEKKNILAVQVFLLYSLFFITESVLSTNKGIAPFVFFSVLIIKLPHPVGDYFFAPPLKRRLNRFLKRLVDIVFSILVIGFVLSWLLPLLALLIKLTSRGPVFFIQERTGKNNIPFSCIKLRSMHINAAADREQAVHNDPRITAVGKFIRKLSLDELPQFFNVLAGSMSVIGPRPHMLQHTHDYSRLVDNYMDRLQVKPGITGLSQVMGYRGEIKNREMIANRVRLDIFYTKNWSPSLDLYIAIRTIKLLLVGEGRGFLVKRHSDEQK